MLYALRVVTPCDQHGRRIGFGLTLALICVWALAFTPIANAALTGSVMAYESTNASPARWSPTSTYAAVPAGQLAAGTSPSATELLGGGYAVAEHTAGGRLKVVTSPRSRTFFGSMAANTNPSITALYAGSPYEVAFQGANGNLMLAHPGAPAQDLGVAMSAGSSPGAAATISGCCAIAVRGTNGDLLVWAPVVGATDTGEAIAPGTSPSLAAEAHGAYEVAFQGVNGDVFTWSPSSGGTDTHAAEAPSTSPSIGTLSTSGVYEVTFQAADSHFASLSTYGDIVHDSGQPMAPGASPSIGTLLGGGWIAAFAAAGGGLYTDGSNSHVADTTQSLHGSSGPAEASSPPILNPWGQGMFGISTDGPMQDEAPKTLARDLNDDAATGAKWLRVDINWAQIQQKGRRSYDWQTTDSIVKRARAHGMNVLGVLIYTPLWAEAKRSCRQADCAPKPADFARFAQTAVRHYAAMGVSAYEVWSEENSTAQWLPKPNPRAYTALLKDAYPAIKRSDPGAIVITGGTSPAPTDGTNYSPTDYLAKLYADGAKPYFDAVGAHPYCWPAYPGQAFTWSSWYQMFGAKRSMRSVMVAHGDAGKQIWGTEFGAATYGPKKSYVSPATQAKMILDGYALWSRYAWAGPLILFEDRDQQNEKHRGAVFGYLGLRFRNFTKKPADASYQRAVSMY